MRTAAFSLYFTIVKYNNTAELVVSQHRIADDYDTSTIPYRGAGTNFAAGLNEIAVQMKNHTLQFTESTYTPILVFMSDGGSESGESEMKLLKSTYPYLQVYVIGFGSGVDKAKMQAMALAGGGKYFFGADGQSLANQFQAVSAEISGGEIAL
jgi:uncharacterized protein YegL